MIATEYRSLQADVRDAATLAPACQQFVRILADSTCATHVPGCTPAAFVAWCQRNKLSLHTLAEHAPTWLTEDASFASALAAERAWFDLQRSEYIIVRDAWLARGIPCLMIKSAGDRPAFPHLSDNIDILVRPIHGPAARDTLREIGYVELRNIEEPQKHLFRRFHDGRCVSAIHVHERIAWFVGFLDDASVWERARAAADDPALTIPSPEDAILINLAHACYENKSLRLVEVLRVRHALALAGDACDWAYLERSASERGWRDGLAFLLLVQAEAERALFGATRIPAARLASCEAIVQTDQPVWERLTAIRRGEIVDLPLDLSYRFCKRLYYRKILADRTRTRQERRRDVAATLIWGLRLKSGLRPQPGFVVSLSGPDGSGKTAHATALVEALALCEIRANYVWSRGGSSGLLRLVRRLPRRSRATATGAIADGSDAVTRRRQRLSHPLVCCTWAWLVALDQLATSLWRVWLPARRGRLVVTDRCAYDTAVEMDASLPANARLARLAIAAMLRVTPRADLSYVLDISAETARARKPHEVWHASFDQEQQHYRQLARRFGLRALSTEGTFAQSNDRLLREVIMTFMAGYETRLNALFYANPSQKNRPDSVWSKGDAR